MIQFMPANHPNTNSAITILIHSSKMHYPDIYVILIRGIAKNVTSLFISRHKCYDFNAVNCCILANENACYKHNEFEYFYTCNYINNKDIVKLTKPITKNIFGSEFEIFKSLGFFFSNCATNISINLMHFSILQIYKTTFCF